VSTDRAVNLLEVAHDRLHAEVCCQHELEACEALEAVKLVGGGFEGLEV